MEMDLGVKNRARQMRPGPVCEMFRFPLELEGEGGVAGEFQVVCARRRPGRKGVNGAGPTDAAQTGENGLYTFLGRKIMENLYKNLLPIYTNCDNISANSHPLRRAGHGHRHYDYIGKRRHG